MDSLDNISRAMRGCIGASVSVVIRTYNRAGTLERAVKSVLHQNYENIELIVVDDGSTDNTAEVLESYRDQLRYVFQENQGLAAGRERGLALADGEFLIYLDSDDWWKPELIAAMAPALERTPAGFAFCEWEYFGRKTGRSLQSADLEKILNRNGELVERGEHGGLVLPSALTRSLFVRRHASAAPSGTLLRREFLTRNFNTVARISDDWVAVLDVVLRKQTSSIYFPEPMWWKLVDGENIYDGSDNDTRAIDLELKDKIWVDRAFGEEISREERKVLNVGISELYVDRAYLGRLNGIPRYSRARDCIRSFLACPNRKAVSEAFKTMLP